MAKIVPFRGVRYNPKRFERLDLTASLPYGQISEDMRERYYQLSPYNVVRLIKGKSFPRDSENDNPYTRARDLYQNWLREKILIRDKKPAFYSYQQEFRHPSGKKVTRQAFLAALSMTYYEKGVILPHERTLYDSRGGYLNLLRVAEVNFDPIFVLYPGDEIDELLAPYFSERPDIDLYIVEKGEVRHSVWIIDDSETIAALQSQMAPKRNLIIADGHHRYETAVAYRDEMREKITDWTPEMAFNYLMVALVSMDDPGLTILPTHRLMHSIPNWKTGEFLVKAEEFFEVSLVAGKEGLFSRMAQMAAKEHAFGLFDGQGYHLLRLRDEGMMDRFVEPSRAQEWKTLDVSILHELVIERVLGLSKESVKRGENINYIREAEEGIEAVKSGQAQFVFFLNPTKISQVRACSAAGEKMPQKSTDFYPKMISGLVMMPLGKEERLG